MEERLESVLTQLGEQNERLSKLESQSLQKAPELKPSMSSEELLSLLEDLQDRLYEIDKSWKKTIYSFLGSKRTPVGHLRAQSALRGRSRQF
ncbi:Hypothetical protein FKW44_012328 [Caligus rogercresseyi]|uniref:Uncharacterized protein n=1 Tax=Caligus rogercresseyi TaxID=217165 RepID=A0A7T8HJC8_CALRO|nr:Hypothetical protein FKW44_012328 [Caligus rogercresseyi]